MDGQTINCLLGDDHEALRKGVAALLESEDDIRVIGQAASGPETLALVERRRPDVLIVDLRMPGMDGVEICRRVKEMDVGTTVVVYSAFDELEALDRALEAGAHGYVLKSAPPRELIRAVHMVCEGRRYIDPALAGNLIDHREATPASTLSAREAEVLQLLSDGLTTDAVGKELFLSPTTVRSYAENAMRKLEARNRVHAVAQALRMGLLS
jgi:DNA-binding NarL/FixJ family response regulator